MLLTFLTWIHVVVALILIFFVLLQDPKGGGAMGVFGGGGGSNSLFGSTGAGNFFSKVTTTAAILFAVLCIGLTYAISHPGSSVLDKTIPASSRATESPVPANLPTPAQPDGSTATPNEKPAEQTPPAHK